MSISAIFCTKHSLRPKNLHKPLQHLFSKRYEPLQLQIDFFLYTNQHTLNLLKSKRDPRGLSDIKFYEQKKLLEVKLALY